MLASTVDAVLIAPEGTIAPKLNALCASLASYHAFMRRPNFFGAAAQTSSDLTEAAASRPA